MVKLTTDITDLTDNYQEIIAARQGIRSIRTIRVRKKDSVVKPTTDETDLTDNSSQLTSSGSIRTIRVRKKKDSVVNLTTDQTLSLQKNATQSHKLQNNQGKSMIAEDSFVPLL